MAQGESVFGGQIVFEPQGSGFFLGGFFSFFVFSSWICGGLGSQKGFLWRISGFLCFGRFSWEFLFF